MKRPTAPPFVTRVQVAEVPAPEGPSERSLPVGSRRGLGPDGGCLDLEHACGPVRKPPVPATEDGHDRGHQHCPHDRGVQEDPCREGGRGDLDLAAGARAQRDEGEAEDQRCARDQASTLRRSPWLSLRTRRRRPCWRGTRACFPQRSKRVRTPHTCARRVHGLHDLGCEAEGSDSPWKLETCRDMRCAESDAHQRVSPRSHASMSG